MLPKELWSTLTNIMIEHGFYDKHAQLFLKLSHLARNLLRRQYVQLFILIRYFYCFSVRPLYFFILIQLYDKKLYNQTED